MADIEKAIGLLSDRGVLDKLKFEAQADRERERDALIAKLSGIEAADEAQGAVLAAEIAKASEQVARFERDLAVARGELAELSGRRSSLGNMSQQMRNRLRHLADPEIDEALNNLAVFMERARQEFRAVESYGAPDKMTGKRMTTTSSNTEEIASVLEACALGRMQLEALKEAPRPADLPAVIAAVLGGVRVKLRTLMGV